MKLTHELTAADKVHAAAGYIADITEIPREQRDLMIRCLHRLTDPRARERIISQLLALEIMDQMNAKKNNGKDN